MFTINTRLCSMHFYLLIFGRSMPTPRVSLFVFFVSLGVDNVPGGAVVGKTIGFSTGRFPVGGIFYIKTIPPPRHDPPRGGAGGYFRKQNKIKQNKLPGGKQRGLRWQFVVFVESFVFNGMKVGVKSKGKRAC